MSIYIFLRWGYFLLDHQQYDISMLNFFPGIFLNGDMATIDGKHVLRNEAS